MRLPSGTVFIHPKVDEINTLGNRHVADVRVFVALRFAFDFEVAHEGIEIRPDDGTGKDGFQTGFAKPVSHLMRQSLRL